MLSPTEEQWKKAFEKLRDSIKIVFQMLQDNDSMLDSYIEDVYSQVFAITYRLYALSMKKIKLINQKEKEYIVKCQQEGKVYTEGSGFANTLSELLVLLNIFDEEACNVIISLL